MLNPFFSQIPTLNTTIRIKFENLVYVLQMQLQQISLALYSGSLDIPPAKPLKQGLPASCTNQSVQVIAAMPSLSVEFKPTTL